mgnify:CR=1 FL=1
MHRFTEHDSPIATFWPPNPFKFPKNLRQAESPHNLYLIGYEENNGRNFVTLQQPALKKPIKNYFDN